MTRTLFSLRAGSHFHRGSFLIHGGETGRGIPTTPTRGAPRRFAAEELIFGATGRLGGKLTAETTVALVQITNVSPSDKHRLFATLLGCLPPRRCVYISTYLRRVQFSELAVLSWKSSGWFSIFPPRFEWQNYIRSCATSHKLPFQRRIFAFMYRVRHSLEMVGERWGWYHWKRNIRKFRFSLGWWLPCVGRRRNERSL